MRYYEFQFITKPNTEVVKDVLTAVLADLGFESFVTEDESVKAYVQMDLFDNDELNNAINNFPIEGVEQITYTFKEVEDRNWNEEWEKNYFQPVMIADRCIIHSTFHKDIPKAEYDIAINPQMAFGTGHHETTSLMIEYLLEEDVTGNAVIDMGCGTSVLAIMASMRGANRCTAIDIDDWCVRNSKENIQLNNISNITVLHGDANILQGVDTCNLFIANINRNILVNDMSKYVSKMADKATLLMSGFYTEDIDEINKSAEENGLTFVSYKQKNNWAAVKFVK
ncbi:MAG: 50S ribosomal protein L11 methyltransferase [Bacteroides sp.]|nr:50S ribosomal protein L11 methyltransferase [Bacteroides sp.]